MGIAAAGGPVQYAPVAHAPDAAAPPRRDRGVVPGARHRIAVAAVEGRCAASATASLTARRWLGVALEIVGVVDRPADSLDQLVC
jgi:hypothetical protein